MVLMSGDKAVAAARERLSRGDPRGARLEAERLVSAAPAYEAGWTLLLDSLMAEGALAKARAAAEAALRRLGPSQAVSSRLALALLHLGAFAEAQGLAEALLAETPNEPETLTTLGRVFAALDLHEPARAAFERALDRRPGDPGLMFNLATSLRNFGALERAEALYDAVLQRRPDDWEAHKNRSELRRQTAASNHISDLTRALARTGQDWRGAVMLHYALGKEQEDLGEHDMAFASYAAGARLRRSRMDYQVERDLERLERLQTVFTKDWFASRPQGLRSSEPIFILGLPRSGSTLLERMLGAHSAIHAAGELQNFGVCVARLAGEAAPGSKDMIGVSAALDPAQLGAAYLTSTRPRAGSSPRFTDKLPGNALYAGLIAAALPDAVVIHIRRDPRDAGLGMFKTLFKQAYPFSYDLDELARYILGHERLMSHWRETLGERLVEVSYEALVEHPQEVVSTVLARCGLGYEPECLEFARSPSATSTASAVQVRQPVYRTSLDAWRRYERQLKPLTDRLERG
jgi:tetratricopeptide (TPR) repeat protein